MLDSIAATRRFAAAFAARTRRGEGGLAELAAIAELHSELSTVIDDIARHLLAAEECSYREIAAALGISQQAAAKRFRGASSRPAGGQRADLR